MHLGAAAVMGANAPENMVHIVINNGAHETVGGMPTVSEKIDVVKIAEGCGYKKAVSVDNESDLIKILDEVKKGTDCLTLIEIKAALGSRADLGRPTLTARQNVENFMNYLKEKN
jgi:phosphonopyruvate decarboxylase